MRTVTAAVVAGLMLGMLPPAASGQDEPAKAPDSWREAATKARLTPEQVERLAADKLVIASKRTYQQAFEGYTDREEVPLFITSDSILAAYHKLFEESVSRVERARATQLAPILRTLWAGLEDEPLFEEEGAEALADRAAGRARVVLGVALRVLGDEQAGADEAELARQIDAIARRVGGDDAAPGEVPAWAANMDFTRFQPRGFYTRSEALKRYFRAVAWLQAAPFPVADDEALAAMLLLGRAVPDEPPQARNYGGLFGKEGADEAEEEDDAEEEDQQDEAGEAEPPDPKERERRNRDAALFHAFFRTYRSFVGEADDWTVLRARELAGEEPIPLDAEGLDSLRAKLEVEWPASGALIDDDPRPEGDGRPQPGFRVLSALRTPDAILFGRTTVPRFAGRQFPSGLDVCAALGSEAAREILRAAHGEELVEVIAERPFANEQVDDDDFGDMPTLYAQYLDCLRPLIDGPERDAPPLFGSRPWQRKSLQTACAGWAQLRHTWALQAKQNVSLFGGASPRPGFVEPEPEFFARLVDLCDRSVAELVRLGALGPDFRVRADELRAMADRIERKDFAGRGAAAVVEEEESADADALPTDLMTYAAAGPRDDPVANAETARRLVALVPELRVLADALERGERPETELASRVGDPDDPIADRWRVLTGLSRSLETMAHKQLRGAAWSERDDAFFESYGDQLCEAMGYPTVYGAEDDAPRAVDVYTSRDLDTQQHLVVATGRPTAMYLLYPWDGQEILCRGVVLPYHEFAHGERLTDTDWRALLDSAEAPPVPDWVRELNNHDREPGRGRN